MAKKLLLTGEQSPRLLLLGIYTPYNTIREPELYFEEFMGLATTLGVHFDEVFLTKIRSVDKAYFLTKGKLEELRLFCQENEIEHIICSEILSALQERNLENVLDCKVFDREQLILEIFQKSAHTAEGKIQVEMAHIKYLKSRLAGKGREFAQQEGRIGARGPGETVKETLRRFFDDRLRQAGKRLESLRKSRVVQRKRRLESKLPLVCLVGYTNAGKSSLLNALTGSEVLAEEKLFATLDTTTREFYSNGTKQLLISDTVGFISHLPHHLVEAFKATLEELMYAHLIIHVIDVSNRAWPGHITVVEQTLKELGVTAPVVYVFNKIDKLSEKDRAEIQQELTSFQPHVLTSTQTKAGVAPLSSYLTSYAFSPPR